MCWMVWCARLLPTCVCSCLCIQAHIYIYMYERSCCRSVCVRMCVFALRCMHTAVCWRLFELHSTALYKLLSWACCVRSAVDIRTNSHQFALAKWIGCDITEYPHQHSGSRKCSGNIPSVEVKKELVSMETSRCQMSIHFQRSNAPNEQQFHVGLWILSKFSSAWRSCSFRANARLLNLMHYTLYAFIALYNHYDWNISP